MTRSQTTALALTVALAIGHWGDWQWLHQWMQTLLAVMVVTLWFHRTDRP